MCFAIRCVSPRSSPVLGVLAQKVPDFLLVNLEVRSPHEVLLVLPQRNVVEDMLESVGDDTPQLWRVRVTLHGMGLTRSGLTVREDGTVVALERRLDDGGRAGVIDVPLRGFGGEDCIEGEILGGLRGIVTRVANLDETAVLVNLANGFGKGWIGERGTG